MSKVSKATTKTRREVKLYLWALGFTTMSMLFITATMEGDTFATVSYWVSLIIGISFLGWGYTVEKRNQR